MVVCASFLMHLIKAGMAAFIFDFVLSREGGAGGGGQQAPGS